MIWLTAVDLMDIHSTVIQKSGGLDGLRDRMGMEAAVAAPLQSFDGEDLYRTTLKKVARLGYGLAANHAFPDSNKRIGAMSVQLLVQWNGYRLVLRTGELADMFIAIADGRADDNALYHWICDHPA